MEYNTENHPHCLCVVFTERAYNMIIGESFKKEPLETGGILLGHILNNGIWLVMEVLPPGPKSIFERAYFEYDTPFVNYLAQSTAAQYNLELSLLGLWHRHPGSFDQFSSTDDKTNTTFAKLNKEGAISGLVNIDPNFRLTMYHVHPQQYYYTQVEIAVGDEMIPEKYFELKYQPHSGEHPSLSYAKGGAQTPSVAAEQRNENLEGVVSYTNEIEEDASNTTYHQPTHVTTAEDELTVIENERLQKGIENILSHISTIGAVGEYVFELKYDIDWFLLVKYKTELGHTEYNKAYIKDFLNVPINYKNVTSYPAFAVSVTDDLDTLVREVAKMIQYNIHQLLKK